MLADEAAVAADELEIGEQAAAAEAGMAAVAAATAAAAADEIVRAVEVRAATGSGTASFRRARPKLKPPLPARRQLQQSHQDTRGLTIREPSTCSLARSPIG